MAETTEKLAAEYNRAVADTCARRCNPPGDVIECDWPECHCDPYAQSVIEGLQGRLLESGECHVCPGDGGKIE